ELAPVEVHPDELHAQLVAEAIDAPELGAHEAVLALLVAIEVVAERVDPDKAVDVDLVERDEEAERHDGGCGRLELLALTPGEEDKLLPGDRLALGALGAPLARGALMRGLVQLDRARAGLVGGRRAARGDPIRERAVDQQVRVAADRRREVAVE